MAGTPKISVIVPVYNVEKYLERCVDSVLNQTFADFELILVDDKSPDNSGKMCDDLAKTDDRIRVIHREKNGGLSAARNSGLDQKRGEYIFFLDSDDFLHKDALKVAYDNLIKTDADISILSPAIVSMDATEAPDSDDEEIEVLDGREALLKRTGKATSAWGKLYKASVFKEFRFIDGRWHEDVHASRRIFTVKGLKAALSSRQMYCACSNPQGFSQSKYTPKKIDDALYIFEDGVKFFAGKGDEELRLMSARKHLHIAKECYFGAKRDLNDKARMEQAHESFKRTFETVSNEDFDETTYKFYKAFAKAPRFYEKYEKIYWFTNGIKSSIKRRIRGQ